MTDEELMRMDLQLIGDALGISAKPYSGHEAVMRDFLPRIRTLKIEVLMFRRLMEEFLKWGETEFPEAEPMTQMIRNELARFEKQHGAQTAADL